MRTRSTTAARIIVLCITVFSIPPAQAEYASRKVRYASGYDILALLHKNFPGNGQPRLEAISDRCDSVNTSNRDALGTSSPISGQALMSKPNPGFLRWLNQCLVEYTRFEFSPPDGYRKGFLKEYLPHPPTGLTAEDYMKTLWTSRPPKEREEILEHMTRKFMGPPSVVEVAFPGKTWKGLTSSIDQTVTTLLPANATTASALGMIAHTLFMRDEFLRY